MTTLERVSAEFSTEPPRANLPEASRLGLQLQRGPFNHTRVPSLLTLPAELENVMHLPTEYRHCFVLGILMGITRPICAELLQLNEDQVCARTCAAAAALAGERRNGSRRPLS
jgi:hypothetical protein